MLLLDGYSQSFKLEARMRNVEKENASLREASATLFAKLFKEMEGTDALHVANKGLATRICKLMAFIQLRGADSWGGKEGRGGAGAGASTSDRGSKLKTEKNVFSP